MKRGHLNLNDNIRLKQQKRNKEMSLGDKVCIGTLGVRMCSITDNQNGGDEERGDRCSLSPLAVPLHCN